MILENKEVIKEYKGKAYVEHVIVMLTPLSEIMKSTIINNENPVQAQADIADYFNRRIDEQIGDMFESEVYQVSSRVRNPFGEIKEKKEDIDNE